MLNVKTDFNAKQPLMVTQLSDVLRWPSSFEKMGEYVRIPTGEPVLLSCDIGFEYFNETDAMVRCTQQKQFLYGGKSHEFDKFQCRTEQSLNIRSTGESCLFSNSEKLEIGYEALGQFLPVYHVCFDFDNYVPLYAEHSINRNIADAELKREEWHEIELLPYDFETIFKCESQVVALTKTLGTDVSWDSKCCFSKRQMVNSRDVLPGLSQIATFHHINLVPQWSSCNSKV